MDNYNFNESLTKNRLNIFNPKTIKVKKNIALTQPKLCNKVLFKIKYHINFFYKYYHAL